jgi:hypothetical protein
VARRPLLMSVGLPVNGRSRARLKFALDRLRQPIAGRSPLLIDYTLRSGRVQLAVAGEWLKVKKGKYKRVLLPLPLKSPTALALFLFLHAINTSPINDTDIRLDRLYARLGIATSKKKGHADFSYTLNRALKAVNDHVNRLDDKVLQAANLEVPAGYEIKARRGDGRIRFEALPRQLPDDEEREYLQSQRKAQETLDEAEHQEERPRLIRRQRPREEVEPEEKQERPRGPVVTQLVRELEQLQTEMKPRVWEPWV